MSASLINSKPSARKLAAFATAFALAAASLAPGEASARDRRESYEQHNGYGEGYHHDRYRRDEYRRDDYRYDRRRHRRDNDDDALAAGVIGLVLGLALGAAASQPAPDRRERGAYDPRYADRAGAYERDYGIAPEAQCTRRERQWDRYANRYLVVDVPC